MATLGRLAASRLLSLSRPAAATVAPRTFSTSARVWSQGWQQYGVPGSNLPFGINNKFLLTVYFCIFFGSAFNLPFVVVAHQLTKK